MPLSGIVGEVEVDAISLIVRAVKMFWMDWRQGLVVPKTMKRRMPAVTPGIKKRKVDSAASAESSGVGRATVASMTPREKVEKRTIVTSKTLPHCVSIGVMRNEGFLSYSRLKHARNGKSSDEPPVIHGPSPSHGSLGTRSSV